MVIPGNSITRFPKSTMASFTAFFTIVAINTAASGQFLYFLEVIVGFNMGTYALLMLIYAVYNALNDPIIGYFSDRPNRFTRRWGRRFPYIVFGGSVFIFNLLILFSTPTVESWGTLGVSLYILLTAVVMDFFFVFFNINRLALFPEKFRHPEDRKFAGTMQVVFETLGVILGFGIPIFVIDSLGGTRSAYFAFAITVTVVNAIMYLIGVSGSKETEEMKTRWIASFDEPQTGFFSGMARILGNKPFVGYMFLYIFYFSTMGIYVTSIPYFVQDILKLDKLGELIIGAYILGIFISIPLWNRLAKSIGIKKTVRIGAAGLGSIGLFFLFMPSGMVGFVFSFILFMMAGTFDGAMISMQQPVLASILDKDTIDSGMRDEGLYNGVMQFIGSLAGALTPFIYWIIRVNFGYDPDPDVVKTDLGLWGLRIQIAVFPFILILIGSILFARNYILTDREIADNAEKLLQFENEKLQGIYAGPSGSICTSCGSEISPYDEFCASCGEKRQ